MTNQPFTTPLVLLVDDIPDLLYAFAFHLEHFEGMRVITAKDGLDGLERFFEARPDCVVIDVRMPQLDGYQLTRALRGDPISAHTPLIMLTAMTQDHDRNIGLASGIDRFVAKPVKPSELAVVIRDVLRISAAERDTHLRQLAQDEELSH